jgi:hypothetical protein
MNFQEKVLEASAELRTRAATLAASVIETAKVRADHAARRIGGLKGSLAVLNGAGREFQKVARRHAIRFVKDNSSLASAVRKDVGTLARSTFASLTERPAPKKARRAPAARKRARKAA